MEKSRGWEGDARASYQELANVLAVPRNVVATRMHSLLTAGALRITAAYDPGFLGQRVISHLSVGVTGSAEAVAASLAALDEVAFVSGVSGHCDVVAEMRVSSEAEFRRILPRVRALDGVAEVLVQRYSTILRGLFVSRYDGSSAVDDIDRRIVAMLQNDGRLPFARISQAVNLTAPAVRSRVKRMLDRGIIAISAVENRGGAGRSSALGFGLTLRDGEPRLHELIRTLPWIEFAACCHGSFDVIGTMTARTPRLLIAQVDRLRAQPGVERVRTWTHMQVIKEDYYRTIA